MVGIDQHETPEARGSSAAASIMAWPPAEWPTPTTSWRSSRRTSSARSRPNSCQRIAVDLVAAAVAALVDRNDAPAPEVRDHLIPAAGVKAGRVREQDRVAAVLASPLEVGEGDAVHGHGGFDRERARRRPWEMSARPCKRRGSRCDFRI